MISAHLNPRLGRQRIDGGQPMAVASGMRHAGSQPSGAILAQSWILRFLAAGLVATSFLDPLRVSPVPYLHNLGSIVGFLLLLAFLIMRFTRARFRDLPGRYIAYFLVMTAIVEGIRATSSGDVQTLLGFRVYLQYSQVAILYLIFFDLARDPRTIRLTGGAFILSTFLMSMASNLRIQVLTRGGEGQRFGTVGLNLNEQALLYALAIVAILCWFLARWPRIGFTDLMLCGAASSMLIAMVNTASRAGAIVLVFGLFVALGLFLRRGKLSAYVSVIPLAIAGVVFVFLGASLLQQRVGATVKTGDTGLRVELTRSGSEMFLEHPVFGWGAWYSRDLGGFMGRGRPMAAHNVYLQMLLSFGLFGFVPWMMAVVTTLGVAWRYRASPWGAILLTILLTALLAGAAANLGHQKIFWVVLAFAGRASVMAVEPLTARRKTRRPPKSVRLINAVDESALCSPSAALVNRPSPAGPLPVRPAQNRGPRAK